MGHSIFDIWALCHPEDYIDLLCLLYLYLYFSKYNYVRQLQCFHVKAISKISSGWTSLNKTAMCTMCLQTQIWTKLINFHASGHYQKAGDLSSVSGRMWVKIERSRQREMQSVCPDCDSAMKWRNHSFWQQSTLYSQRTHTHEHTHIHAFTRWQYRLELTHNVLLQVNVQL